MKSLGFQFQGLLNLQMSVQPVYFVALQIKALTFCGSPFLIKFCKIVSLRSQLVGSQLYFMWSGFFVCFQFCILVFLFLFKIISFKNWYCLTSSSLFLLKKFMMWLLPYFTNFLSCLFFVVFCSFRKPLCRTHTHTHIHTQTHTLAPQQTL